MRSVQDGVRYCAGPHRLTTVPSLGSPPLHRSPWGPSGPLFPEHGKGGNHKAVVCQPIPGHPTQHRPTPTPVCWSQLSHRGGDHSSIGGGRGFNDPDAGSLAQRCLPPVHKDTEGTPGGHCRSHGPLPLSSGRPGWGRTARALRR